ncbi:YraN family protein [Ruminococcaceae bacterium OttesenSCG-928-O06]|nr:YraN family protein [Ruminococcaceae bacterium OttesenSCG-928-O06]
MNKNDAGRTGEDAAARAYAAAGYRLLRRNFATRLGEVDLILEKDDLVVFCEVKARSEGAIAAPAEWVDAKKQRKVLAAAQIWLQQQGLTEAHMRFDVAEVYLAGAAPPRVHIIENAFGA